MSEVKITVGGAMEDEGARHVAFESWDALARVLTGKRMELLRYVRRHNLASVR
jgi:predicted transcriptional regulator